MEEVFNNKDLIAHIISFMVDPWSDKYDTKYALVNKTWAKAYKENKWKWAGLYGYGDGYGYFEDEYDLANNQLVHGKEYYDEQYTPLQQIKMIESFKQQQAGNWEYFSKAELPEREFLRYHTLSFFYHKLGIGDRCYCQEAYLADKKLPRDSHGDILF